MRDGRRMERRSAGLGPQRKPPVAAPLLPHLEHRGEIADARSAEAVDQAAAGNEEAFRFLGVQRRPQHLLQSRALPALDRIVMPHVPLSGI